jgi:hypothetical protein
VLRVWVSASGATPDQRAVVAAPAFPFPLRDQPALPQLGVLLFAGALVFAPDAITAVPAACVFHPSDCFLEPDAAAFAVALEGGPDQAFADGLIDQLTELPSFGAGHCAIASRVWAASIDRK